MWTIHHDKCLSLLGVAFGPPDLCLRELLGESCFGRRKSGPKSTVFNPRPPVLLRFCLRQRCSYNACRRLLPLMQAPSCIATGASWTAWSFCPPAAAQKLCATDSGTSTVEAAGRCETCALDTLNLPQTPAGSGVRSLAHKSLSLLRLGPLHCPIGSTTPPPHPVSRPGYPAPPATFTTDTARWPTSHPQKE